MEETMPSSITNRFTQNIFRIIPICLIFLFSSVPLVFSQTPLRWINFPNPAFEVNGLAWFSENTPDLFRLPKRMMNLVRPPVWQLAKNPSGGRIRFRSDCSTLAIRLEYPELGRMNNMHTFGQSGVDLYSNGSYIKTAIPTDSTFVEFYYFRNITSRSREFTLYLPLYKGVRVVAIGMNNEASIAPPQPFILNKPVVYYGTSITQGGCASRPGMSYQAILSRHLNLNFVNLGFSGNGKGEPELAHALAEIDAACYVLDFAANNAYADSLKKVYGPFLDILRKKRPEVPIIAITPIFFTGEFAFSEDNQTINEMRNVIRNEVTKRIAAGDKILTYVEGTDLLGPDLVDGHVDGVHPNDLGFQAMADRLMPTLIRVLGLAHSEPLLK